MGVVADGNGAPDNAATPDKRERYRLAERFKAAGQVKPPTLADIHGQTYDEPRPVIREFLYPGAWLLVGRPKVGKSWMLLQLALAVAEGGTFLGFHCQQSEVLTLFSEDTDRRIKQRLDALGVANAPEGCHVFNRSNLAELARDFAEDMSFENWLLLWLKQHPKVRLVVVDTEVTCRQVWTGECQANTTKVTESDYKATRQFDEIALMRDVSILLVNHASKQRGGKLLDLHEMINRSMTAVAGASGSIVLADPPGADPLDTEQRMRVLAVRGRDLDADKMLAVHQEKDVPYFLSDGVYREVVQSKAEDQIMEALREVSEQLGDDDYAKSNEIAARTDMTQSTVRQYLCRMARKPQYQLKVKTGPKGGYRLGGMSSFPPGPPLTPPNK